MKIRHALPLFLSLAAGAVGAAETDLVSINWSPEGHFVHEAMLPASRFVEVCGQLAAGTRIDWTFEATAPLNFNTRPTARCTPRWRRTTAGCGRTRRPGTRR
jgi:hypothetical protein